MVMYKIESAEMISLLVTRNYLSIDVGHGGAQTNRDGENNPKQKADPLMILKHYAIQIFVNYGKKFFEHRPRPVGRFVPATGGVVFRKGAANSVPGHASHPRPGVAKAQVGANRP